MKEVLRIFSVAFVEWVHNQGYVYYFNGEEWMWAQPKKQDYKTTDELFEIFYSGKY